MMHDEPDAVAYGQLVRDTEPLSHALEPLVEYLHDVEPSRVYDLGGIRSRAERLGQAAAV